MPSTSSPTSPLRLALWYGKGGVGKSTTTLLLSLLAAKRGERVLVIDLDPECGTSRDFLGTALPRLQENLKTFLASSLPVPPPILQTGIVGLDLVAGAPDQQRFFRHYPEHSTRLADALMLLPNIYDWVLMDVPNQFDNVAELGLIAADYVILPVELTADCRERVDTAHAPDVDYKAWGFDAILHFLPRLGALLRPLDDCAGVRKLIRNLRLGVASPALKVYDYLDSCRQMLVSRAKLPAYPCALVGWDNTPRRGKRGIIMVNPSPAKFGRLLSEAVASVNHRPADEQLVFINAWNEWAEGAHLEPDQKMGHDYLRAVQSVATASRSQTSDGSRLLAI